MNPRPCAYIEVRRSLPVPRDEIPPHAHVVREIVRLWPLRDRCRGCTERSIPIATENQRTSYVAQMPSQGRNDGHQRVAKRVQVIGSSLEHVERKRDIDRKPSRVQRKFQFVWVIDVPVQIRFGEPPPPFLRFFRRARAIRIAIRRAPLGACKRSENGKTSKEQD